MKNQVSTVPRHYTVGALARAVVARILSLATIPLRKPGSDLEPGF